MCLPCRSHRFTGSGRVADVVVCYCRNGLLHIRLMAVDLSWWKRGESLTYKFRNSVVKFTDHTFTNNFQWCGKYAQHCKNHSWNVKCLGFDINQCKEQKFLQFALNIEHLFSFKWEFVQRNLLLRNGNGSFPGHQILNIIKVSCLLNKVTELKAALIVLHNSNSVSFILTQHSQIPALIRKSYNFGGTKLRFQ